MSLDNKEEIVAEAQGKTLPLEQTHKTLGALIKEFAGWNMPIRYQGIVAEHKAVREKAGLFDVSHMGELRVSGETAQATLQKLTTNDAEKIKIGQAQYTLLSAPDGTCIDDLIIYCTGLDAYILIVNASNCEKDLQWLTEHALAGTRIENVSDAYALFALQGPLARNILQKLTSCELALMKTFRIKYINIAGIPVMASTTGYTGEHGFELLVPVEHAQKAWDTLMEAGTPDGMMPCGLGARDTLRIEAGLPLYGHELSDKRSLWSALPLRKFIKLEKDEFCGRKALLVHQRQKACDILIGFEITERSLTARAGDGIFNAKGSNIGVVTSGMFSHQLNKNIGMGYVRTPYAPVNSQIIIEIAATKKRVKAQTTALPIYKRERSAQ